MADKLTEWGYGEGAVRVFGKILMMERAPYEGEAKTQGVELGNMIAGAVITHDGKGLLSRTKDKNEIGNFDESLEMWEVELVIIPRKKFRKNRTEEDFATLEITQMLAGAWWNNEDWKEQIFPKDKETSCPKS